MTENNIDTANEAAAEDKGENTVQIAAASKEKAEAMKKKEESEDEKISDYKDFE